MRPITICVVLALLVVVSLHGEEAKKKKPHCDHKDKTDPKALTGEGGDRQKYHLSWLTDVDDVGQKFKYVRIVSNLKDTLLPCKWEKAQIEFEEIKGQDCGFNFFESTHAHKEETNTTIKFGQRLEHSINNASLFVVNEAAPQQCACEKEKKTTQDKNGLHSKIGTGDFSFEFVSSFDREKASISYLAAGFDTARKVSLRFKVDALLEHLNKTDKNLKSTIMWKKADSTEENVFIAASSLKSKDSVFTIERLVEYKIVEKIFQVEIINKDNKTRAKGIVAVHVPVKK